MTDRTCLVLSVLMLIVALVTLDIIGRIKIARALEPQVVTVAPTPYSCTHPGQVDPDETL